MPPRKKREEDVLARALSKLGVNVEGKQSVGDLIRSTTNNHYQAESTAERVARAKRELEMANERTQLEAESVLYFIEVKGKGFHDKVCKWCKEQFASTYRAVSYCSSLCRYEALAAVGIVWNIYGKTDTERWGGRIPKVLSPEAYKAAMEVIKNQVDEELEESTEEEIETPVDLGDEESEIEYQEYVAGDDD